MSDDALPVPGRECGDCALCCKLPQIPALNKPAGQWCQHCTSHRSCGYYEHRPQMCRDFFCLYMTNEGLDESWKPTRSRFVLRMNDTGQPPAQLIALVDPERADAWRREPYHSNLKQWSHQFHVIISIGEKRIVLFPDHEVDLGTLASGDVIEFIRSAERTTARLRRANPEAS